MRFTLDTNFLIDAARIHFPVKEHPDFWMWLVELGRQQNIFITEHVYREVIAGNDFLADWIKINRNIFIHKSLSYIQSLPHVLQAYGNDIDEVTLEKLGADPFVIAHAIILNGCVVTREIPNNATAVLNKKISSICMELKVPCYTFSRFMWEVRKTMP